MEKIDVSIFMLTYNQELFIKQTIESVLMQKTSFNFQLVIGEDCSTDNTRRICERFAINNPTKVKLLYSKDNLGLIQNFIRTIKECTGKYIAILDGDDYWIDPLKLQKQFDFLENNLDYSIVFTGIEFLYPNGDFTKVVWDAVKETSKFEDLIFSNFIPSATVLFRNKKEEENFPDWINHFPYGDWPIYLWITKNGDKIKYLEEVTAVYRKEIGVSEKLKKVPSDIIKVNLEIVDCVFNDPDFLSQRELAKKSLQQHQFALMASYLRENKFLNSFSLAIDLLKNEPAKVIRTYLYLLKRAFLK